MPTYFLVLLRSLQASLFLLAGIASAVPFGLRGQLENLASQSGFTVEGLESVSGESPFIYAEGTPVQQIKVLLQNYNYLLIQDSNRPGGIEKLKITSLKTLDPKSVSGTAYIDTVRVGTHHQVNATLIGPNGSSKTLPLLVDTGATTLVLPSSMIEDCGFTVGELRDGVSHTASGTTPVKMGILRSVQVGSVSTENVEISFIDDKKLHGAKLLGMSFLRQFRMTLDDERNELTLMAK